MKKLYILLPALLMATQVWAQIKVSFTINTNKARRPVSPYIFGVNTANGVENADDSDENIGSRRQGGNRLTSYNWENNASNAGEDYKHSSDNWLNSITGVPSEKENEPAALISHMHDKSLEMKTYSLITVQMAGYVTADKNGEVSTDEIAPSPRWKQVKAFKRTPFAATPDFNDDFVYTDEMIGFLVKKYGSAATPSGIKGYSLDNEPALWSGNHKRIHPTKPTCAEMFRKSITFARAIKSVDPAAMVFGGAYYGYGEHHNFQGAKDWHLYKVGYKSYTDAFLDKMKHASDSIGVRLIDVLDFHWYPEARGINNEGKSERICEGGSNDKGVAEARMQAPRTLWDSTYLEKSWVAESFGKVQLIPSLQKSINHYYPGTQLAFTEFDYGGGDHISGGIAMADVFGIFARYGVFMSNYWKAVDNYASAAYKIYRNYNAKKSTWGNVSIASETSDIINSSVYAAFETADSSALHIIVINKNWDQVMNGQFKVNSTTCYKEAKVYQFNSQSSDIKQVNPVSSITTENTFSYSVPPLSVSHLVLRKK